MTNEEAIEYNDYLLEYMRIIEKKSEYKFLEENYTALEMAIEALKAQPKNGKWIETPEGTVCSECGKYPYDDGEYHIANWNSDYCPNCGAKMEIKVPTAKAHKEAEP